MAYLHITFPDGKKEVYALASPEITLGRNHDNDIVLRDGQASRLHAKILSREEGHAIRDMGSYNGTRVNGKMIKDAVLEEADEIRIGRSSLIFSGSKKPPSTRSPQKTLESLGRDDAWGQTVISSVSDLPLCKDSSLLLKPSHPAEAAVKKRKDTSELQEEMQSLERSNKALFVLYEVSRQLNALVGFEELLAKIMDLIFMVIEADYGFVFLIEGDDIGDLTPVVVKSKRSTPKDANSLVASRTIIRKVIQEKVALLTSNAMDDSRLDLSDSIIQKRIIASMCVPLWDKDNVIGVIQLNSTRLNNLFSENDLELLKTIGCQMSMVIAQARLNRQIKEEEEMRRRLERFHSPQVVEMILKSGQENDDSYMESKEVVATVLFTDIAGFTPMAERMPPREVTQLLNRHFSRMTDIIFEFDGTLDKYIGDGLMAVFGAPVGQRNDAERAIRAALSMRQDFLETQQSDLEATRFDMRLGINSGKVVAGNIGSPRRMDYTVIGDVVNVASRLESSAGPNQILIGEETYRLVKGLFTINPVGPKELKGKSEAIQAYEVLD